MRIDEIQFRTEFSETAHPRYDAIKPLIARGATSFRDFRDVFERLVAEKGLLTGKLIELVEEPTGVEPETSDPVAGLVEMNQHARPRVAHVAEILSAYVDLGPKKFWNAKPYTRSVYYRHRLQQSGARAAESAVRGIVTMHDRLREAGALVPEAKLSYSSSPLEPTDVPWAIDYLGYSRRRDGAHRRAIAHFLGWQTIPVLEFQFDRVTPEFIMDNCSYIQQNFGAFRTAIYALRERGTAQAAE